MCGPAIDLSYVNRVEVRSPYNSSVPEAENIFRAHSGLFASFPNHRVSRVEVETSRLSGEIKCTASLHEISAKEHAHDTGWAITMLNAEKELRRHTWPKGDYLYLLRKNADLKGGVLKLESGELRKLFQEPFVPAIVRVSAADKTCAPYDISRDLAAKDWATT